MNELMQLLHRHLLIYPAMQIEDCVKLLYQSILGGGHLIDAPAFQHRLEQEIAQSALEEVSPLAPESIGNRMYRIPLNSTVAGIANHTLTQLFADSAAEHQGSGETLVEKLLELRELVQMGWLPYSAQAAEFIDLYLLEGCPQLHHSERYRVLYKPHYRLLDLPRMLYLPVFKFIDNALRQKPQILVGVDGMSHSGKTRLAALLHQVYGAGIIRADDFFLRPEQRGPIRLMQPGGNIDYERLGPVIRRANGLEDISYQAYDCGIQQLGEWVSVPTGPVTVVEGSYAMHPELAAAYDVKIFLSVDATVQHHRVLTRSNAMADRFFTEWIPMENTYFAEYRVREGSDVAIDTSSL